MKKRIACSGEGVRGLVKTIIDPKTKKAVERVNEIEMQKCTEGFGPGTSVHCGLIRRDVSFSLQGV